MTSVRLISLFIGACHPFFWSGSYSFSLNVLTDLSCHFNGRHRLRWEVLRRSLSGLGPGMKRLFSTCICMPFLWFPSVQLDSDWLCALLAFPMFRVGSPRRGESCISCLWCSWITRRTCSNLHVHGMEGPWCGFGHIRHLGCIFLWWIDYMVLYQ